MKIFEKAQWILADYPSDHICDKYFEYQTSFSAIPGRPTTLYISASTQYAVFVNGCFVDCGQYEAYEDYQAYDTLDITNFLTDGINELKIGHYVCGADFSTRRKQLPGIIFEIHSGERCLVASDCDCLSRENRKFLENQEKITGQLGFNFEYDARLQNPAYAPSILAGKEKHLYERPIKKLILEPFTPAALCAQGLFLEPDASLPKAQRMQTAFLSACRKKEYLKDCEDGIHWSVPCSTKADGFYLVFDLEKESAGLLEFSLEVPEDTEVLIGFGEHLDDLRVRTFVGNRNFCFRYVAGKGLNTFFYPYQRLGLRYLQFHVYSKEGTLTAGIRAQHYPLTKHELSLTDALHRKIYDVGCNTLELCMHEHYEDCPWREQALYAMDSRVQILCGYYAFREYAFPRATLLLMLRSLRPDGLLELCSPGNVTVNIPAFTAVFVREVLEYVEYSKDLDFAEQIFNDLKKIVDGFAKRLAPNSLAPLFCGQEYWNFYEWRDGLDGSERFATEVFECPLNVFISDAFRCFGKLCEMLSPELAEHYLSLHRQVNQAMHTFFFDEQQKAYLTRLGDTAPRHTLTQSLMLYVDAVPAAHQNAVADAITHGNLISCSVSMTIYVYEALLQLGDTYKDYVLKEIERIWGQMLFAGADTFWETEIGADDFDYAGSLCHGWSAVPVYLFGKYFI